MFGTVNAHCGYFEAGVAGLAKAEVTWPAWLSRLLTHPVKGLENHEELFQTLFEAENAIKVYAVISQE